jgi:hypothetical protein
MVIATCYMLRRSYWIPGSYAPALSEKCNSLLRLLKNKGFKEESMTKVGVYAIDTSTTLESNKSLRRISHECGAHHDA